MKKFILQFSFLICGIVLLQSCSKNNQETKYVNLDENIQAGSTYSLNLGTYADRTAVASITTQASDYTVSQLDKDAASGCSIYHFSTDSKTKEKQTVVLNLTGKKSGQCSRNDNKTVISINFTVQ
ncbi:MAG: hypothetical protein ABIN36_05160 [Ferruginibacter sp.]